MDLFTMVAPSESASPAYPARPAAKKAVKRKKAENCTLDLFSYIAGNIAGEPSDPVRKTLDLFDTEIISAATADTLKTAVNEERQSDEEEHIKGPCNYRITGKDEPTGSLKARFQGNVEAIRTLKMLEDDYRHPTAEEQSILCKYVGFGGLPHAFAENNEEWKEEYGILKELLTEHEYESAKASTLNAHYTSFEVVSFMYQALMKMGFRGGNIIEPALGVGYFFGLLPDEIAGKCALTGIEIDSLTGRIAQKLYPVANIKVNGYEKVRLADNLYDAAVSNVPFGDYKVHDPEYHKLKFSIHDYFFAKTIDKVRPGGIVMFITSRFTMDKQNSGVREYIAERANLVAAIRLPDNAFRKIANTEVTTDIIILQKKTGCDESCGEDCGQNWLRLDRLKVETKGRADKAQIEINEYFTKHPEMMLGKMMLVSSEYGYTPALKSDGTDIKDALSTALQSIPADIYRESENKGAISETAKIAAPEDVKEGAYVVNADGIFRKLGDSLVPEKMQSYLAERIKGLTVLRDKVRSVIRRQQEIEDDAVINQDIEELNYVYDRFVKQFGYMHARSNNIAFRNDPDYPLLLALEHWDDEAKSADKADIFRKRVMYPQKRVDFVESAKEALLVSLNEYGRINFDRMSVLTGKTMEQLIEELGALAFKNPETGNWETAEEYLSGNVRRKLDVAINAAETDSAYYKNAEALKGAQPVDLKFSEIEARLGAPWIPPEDVAQFINHIVSVENAVSVTYAAVIGSWAIDYNSNCKSSVYDSVDNTAKWGTGRISAVELIEQALNHKLPTIKDPAPDDKYVVNVKETEAAREKQYNLKEEFKSWIWRDQERRERLVEKYNREINNIRERQYDGSHLTFPGMNSDITFRPHQKDSVWRIMADGNTLLWHVVGSGKTFCCAASVMEMKRIGLINKALITVPNHLVDQWGSEFLRLYPCANILLARKDDFVKSKRQVLMSRIATGNWDAVIVAHSSFEKLPVSKDTIEKFMRRQIADLESSIRAMKDDGGTRMVKRLEKTKKRFQEKLKERLNEHRKDNTISFEDLGVDQLYVDEADMFKNLFFSTKMTRVAGLPNTESNRAFDMYTKTQWLNEKHGERRIVFATGTAVSNTVAEMFTMQRYLQPQALRGYGFQHFDSWAHAFGEIISSLEIAPDGSGYRVNSRFARFTNIPELMALFKMTADIKTADMLTLPKPDLKGNKPITIAAPVSAAQKAFTNTLVARAEAIKTGGVQPWEDNMLAITTDGRKAALDMRLIDPASTDEPGSKINLAVNNIFDIWKETYTRRLTQMVFCDMSTPNSKSFNIYDDIKTKLIALGIPKEQIAYIHDANTDLQKKTLFEKVRAGRVRIIMGSTEKMGAGTNVQRLLYALHHLDAPWRPRDIEQREGRILRQGNENSEVSIYRYVTEQSFDAYIWQTLEIKARFISQISRNSSSVRTADDIEGAVLTYAEVKALASGNPLVMEKFKVDTEIRRLNLLQSQFISEKYDMQSELGWLPRKIRNREQYLESLQKDIALKPSGDEFAMTINGVTYTDRKKAGFQIQKSALSLRGTSQPEEIGTYGGFTLYIRSTGYSYVEPTLIAKGHTEFRGNISSSDIGTIMSLEHDIREMEHKIGQTKAEIQQSRQRLENLAIEVNKTFPHEEKLQELHERQKEIYKALDLDKNKEQAAVIGDDNDMVDMMEIAA